MTVAFFKTDDCDQDALHKLETDEIITHDANAGGYFITHDVYEEWALDKLIEQAFIGAKDYKSFYQDIGSSLPIRRAFRSWLSDKLFAEDDNAKLLIEFTIKDDQGGNHWKDEVLVSALVSDYSSVFFEHFEEELLEEPEKVVSQGSTKVARTSTVSHKYEEQLLHRILFLLRIACKTIDENFLRLSELKSRRDFAENSLHSSERKRMGCSHSFHKRKDCNSGTWVPPFPCWRLESEP